MYDCKITIYTQVYNTTNYLDRCFESVVKQTHTNFEWLLVDNGSTDGSSEKLVQFSKTDSRIQLIKLKENRYGPRFEITKKYATGDYYTVLDSDDWWEPDYLERLIAFAEKNRLDIALTGTIAYLEKDQIEQLLRKLDASIVLTREQFAQCYPQLWTFPSTVWGSVMRKSVMQQVNFDPIIKQKLVYGGDTVGMLEVLKHCDRIGIDNSALYHYRIHPKSITYQYDPRRFDANIVYYEAIQDFLNQHNTLDPQKQNWLKAVHLASMVQTLQLLAGADISVQEQLTECLRIIEHPLTSRVLTFACDARENWYHQIRVVVSTATSKIKTGDDEKLVRRILRFISPDCADAFAMEYRMLYAQENSLWIDLLNNNRETALSTVLDWIAQNKYCNQFDLDKLANSLISQGSLLKNVFDAQFFRIYPECCQMILKTALDAALDQMTGVLLENEVLYAEERFLTLFLSIAALKNQIPAFLYGNIRLAYLYFNENRLDDCRKVLNDLDEMGAGEHEDVLQLRRTLEKLV